MPSVTYKCPNCDAPLVFTPGTQGFYCDFCKSAFTKEELDSKAGTEDVYKRQIVGKAAKEGLQSRFRLSQSIVA